MDFPLAWVNKYRKRLLSEQPFFCYFVYDRDNLWDNSIGKELLLCLECESIEPHLLEHGYETIAAGGGEVLL